MNEDLKIIKESRLILKRTDVAGGHRSCEWRSKASVATGVIVEGDVLPDTMFLQSADLAFTAYTLGKKGMSSKYCPYCPLAKVSWMPSCRGTTYCGAVDVAKNDYNVQG